MDTEFSKENLKKMLESVLPNNVSIEEYRLNLRTLIGRLLTAGTSPKEAFDIACVDSTLKSALKIAYPHKFDIEFYDLICISILVLNQENKMLCNFLCTEMLQTTFDDFCQEIGISTLQRITTEQSDKNDAHRNNGIHSSLNKKIIGYNKLKEFIDSSKNKYANIEIDSVKFNNAKIEISITSWAECYNSDANFSTHFPVGNIKIELDDIVRIVSDTWRWDNIANGTLEMLPSNDDCIELSYIHSYTNTPFFKFKCKKVTIVEYTPSGFDLPLVV